MAQVTNESSDGLDVPVFGLIFEPGQTVEVEDDIARQLGVPFKVSAAPAVTSAAVAAPAGGGAAPVVAPTVAEAQAEVEKAAADLAAAEATPAAPAQPEGVS